MSILPKSSDFDSSANHGNILKVKILQKHIGEICSIKCPYSGGNGVDCHWHLSAWCSRWWSLTVLPSGRPCPWLESQLGTVLCFLDPCWATLSWWYLWIWNGNSGVEGEALTIVYGIIYLCRQMETVTHNMQNAMQMSLWYKDDYMQPFYRRKLQSHKGRETH